MSFLRVRSWPLLAAFIYIVLTIVYSGNVHQAEIEGNEFAEFEEFDEEEDDEQVIIKESSRSIREKEEDLQETIKVTPNAEEEVTVEDEEEDDDEIEFEHFQDDEEFEGFESGKPSGKPTRGKTAEIKIAKVPIHLRTNWDSFYLEMLMVAGLVVYFLNFIAGKTKNQKIANSWFSSHKQLLNLNFHVVGDNEKGTENEGQCLTKESENIYTLWCSGRTSCEGMLLELQLIKRQDLVHIMMQMLRPASDQIVIKVNMNPDDMDTFVFAMVTKKLALKLSKEMADISTFCSEIKSVDRCGLPSSFVLYNELPGVPLKLLDTKVTDIISHNESLINYIHFSDQYTGPKLPDENQITKVPDVKKVLMFSFNMPGRGRTNPDALDTMKPLLQLVFYLMEKIRAFKLGKDVKQKAEKTRNRIEEEYLKMTHQQRVEAAQQRREEKRRAEKERIMNEDDPEKQRKWEEREHRRELKKRAPKMKQLKVKAL